MKATGIVRRVDQLGRIVIPKDIRKELCIKEGDAFDVLPPADYRTGRYLRKNVCSVFSLQTGTLVR